MKISKEDFESMKKKYDQEVKKGKPAKDKKGKDKTDQTNWIFLDRETLESLLAKADQNPKKGGIQFYFTEYTEKTAKERYGNDSDKYIGQMTLVMRAANLEENMVVSAELTRDGSEYENSGTECPFVCEPSPTVA
jgi:hypothetical protein